MNLSKPQHLIRALACAGALSIAVALTIPTASAVAHQDTTPRYHVFCWLNWPFKSCDSRYTFRHHHLKPNAA